MVRNCNIMVRNGQCMVRNGNSLVRNGNLIYGTKWLWYEMTVYHLKYLYIVDPEQAISLCRGPQNKRVLPEVTICSRQVLIAKVVNEDERFDFRV